MQASAMVLGATLLCGGIALGEAKKAAPGKAAPAKDPQQQAMMEAWQKAATPGPAHARLKALAGTFDATVRSWMKPGAPPQESKGRNEAKMILDGRFLQEEFKGAMMGQPFLGQGLTGYDNTKKKYVGTWVDSMGTSLAYMEGTADEAGKVLTMSMTAPDPMTGKDVQHRAVTRIESDARHVFEIFEPGPDGKEYRSLEIVYTRAK